MINIQSDIMSQNTAVDNKINTISIGLIGLGKMGQNHLRILSMLKNVDLKFIYDKSVDVLYDSAHKYNVKPSTNLIEDLKTVDAVVIVTPTSTHFEYLNLVSDYVKNIFVEKPLTGDLQTSKKISQLAEEKDVNIQIGFIERFNPTVIELKKILSKSSNVLNVDFTRTNKVSSRIKDVDVIMDLMIHDIDLALYLNGDVESIQAFGHIRDEMVVFASAYLKHKNNRLSRITASRITEKRIRQISVTCEDMYIDCDLLRKEMYINKQTVHQNYDYLSVTSIEEAVQVSNQEALLSEMVSFSERINGSSKLVNIEYPDLSSSLKSMYIADQIQKQIKG